MVKFQTFFDWVFQINTLNKDQKRMFIDLIEKDLSGFGFKKSVTRKKTQPHYWWGCRWNSIFRQQAWSRATKRVLLIVPQIVSELSNAKINDDVNHYIVLR